MRNSHEYFSFSNLEKEGVDQYDKEISVAEINEC